MFKPILFILSGLLIAQDDGLKSYQSGNFDEARKYYESILDKKVEDAAAQFGLGTTAFQQQDFQRALGAFKKAMETDKIDLKSKAFYNMANTMVSLQKNEEAIDLFRKALELNPDDKDAKHNYEMLRYKQKQEQQQENQDQNSEEKDQKQENQQEQKSNEENKENQDQEQKDNDQQSEENQDQDLKEQQEKQAKEIQEKQQDLEHAKAILDAMKKDEKVNQKRQMSRTRSKKLEKDW